jgi:hypothetical protein
MGAGPGKSKTQFDKAWVPSATVELLRAASVGVCPGRDFAHFIPILKPGPSEGGLLKRTLARHDRASSGTGRQRKKAIRRPNRAVGHAVGIGNKRREQLG